MIPKILTAIIIALLIVVAWLSSERAKHLEYILGAETYFSQFYKQCRAIENEVLKLRQDRKTVSR